MKDEDKTKEQLINEFAELRQRITELEESKTEWKQTEKELIEAKDCLNSLTKSSLDSIMFSDRRGYITKVNKYFLELLGYREEEVVGKFVADLTPTNEDESYESVTGELVKIDKELLNHTQTMIDVLLTKGKVSNWEAYYLRKDKKVVPIEQNIVCLSDEKGERTGAVAIIRDITERRRVDKELERYRNHLEYMVNKRTGKLTKVNKELQLEITDRKQAEEALRKSEEKYHNIIEYANDAIISVNKEGIIISFNKKGEEMLGYSSAEILGKSITLLSPERDREREKKAFEKLKTANKLGVVGKTLEGKGLRKDGQEIPVESSVFTLGVDGELVITSIMRNITERKQSEEEIRKIKDYLDNIIESSLDCIIVSDSKGYFERVNKSFLEMLDYKKEEVIGKHMTEFVPINEGIYESTTGETVQIDKEFINDSHTMISRLVEEGKISQWESYFMRKDKKVIPVESNSVYLYNEKGDKIGSLGIIRDITERKKAEKELKETTIQLVQSEKLSALGELTAGVAHELNQPLNGIKIISQSLLKDIKRGQLEQEELVQDLHDVVNQVDKMAEIIDHMRIYTRRTEGMPNETIDINSLIEGAFKFLGQQLKNHNIEVIEELGSDLPKVVGDPIRLEQVFLNIINNARNALEGSGKKNKRIEIRTYAANTNGDFSVVMEVSDNGGGVPEHIRGKIFQPFFTTNAPGKGTGLGLSVSNKIIEEHQGRIELDSTVGEGATFRVILPVVE